MSALWVYESGDSIQMPELRLGFGAGIMTSNGKKYIVQQYGFLWAMTERNYKKLCGLLKKGAEYDLNNLGRPIGEIDCNALSADMEEEDEDVMKESDADCL